MSEIKTGIYIRVSTDEQVKHGFSINAQKEKLVYYATIKDWLIYKIYIDEGISGKNLNRPKIQELLHDIKVGNVNNVLVFKIDRLTRSTKDLIDLVDLFQKYKCDFNSFSESIDTSSPTGRMFIKIIGLFAEFERETIVERIKVGLERKVKEGYSLCSSTASYGYKRLKGQKIQEICDVEAANVRYIYKMYIQGKTIGEIRNILNFKKISTKKDRLWSNKMILNILTNPNYIGKVRYGVNTNKYFEEKGRHEAIISKAVYDEVQRKLKNRLRTKSDAYYSNKLFCRCTKKMLTKRTYINNRCYINYHCPNKKCSIKSISHKKIDKYLRIDKCEFIKRYEYVQNNIASISIISSEKDMLVVYNCVNIIATRFTVIKK